MSPIQKIPIARLDIKAAAAIFSPMKQPPYSLADLVELFGVPERTVRSWIQKGLLPRPRGRGPASFYDQEHADRLGFIVRLREAASRSGSAGTSWRDTMLPLETIREILDGLDPEMVHRVATGEEPLAVADLMSTSAPMMLADAAAPPPARSMPPRQSRGQEPSTTIQLGDGLELRLQSDEPERVAWLARLARRVRELIREDDF